MADSANDKLLKKIKFRISRKLDSRFVGQYRSAFKGNGLQFETVREYQFGDEIKSIDWNVSARMNHLYVKEFIEERELNIVLMIDISGSMKFGSKRKKNDVLMEIATLLLFLAEQNNDRMSVMLFTDKVEWFFTPKKGRKYVLKVVKEILDFKPESRKTDISAAIDFSLSVLKKRSIVFVISDFIDNSYLIKLKRLRRKHDIIPVMVSDPLEKKFNFLGLTQFYDLENNDMVFSSIPGDTLKNEIQGFDVMSLSTSESVENSILKYFEKRNKKRLSRW